MDALITYVLNSSSVDSIYPLILKPDEEQLKSVLAQNFPHKQILFNGTAVDKQEEIAQGVPAVWVKEEMTKQQIVEKFAPYTSHFVFLGAGFTLAESFTRDCIQKIQTSQGYYKIVYTDYNVGALTMYMEPFSRTKFMQTPEMKFGPMLIEASIFKGVQYNGSDLDFVRSASSVGMVAHIAETLAFV